MRLRWRLLSSIVVLLQAFAQAALPVVVDGQPLPSLAPMIERTAPAVVNIASSKVERGALIRDPFWGQVFRQPPRREQSLGSGVIVDARQGYILTNQHVIDHADAITVRLHDGREFQAKLVGSDRSSDVAVIQIKAPDLTALPLADSDKVRVGDFVVAIGNPFNLGQSVTSGIVSAVGRQGLGIEDFEDFIQTDAAINPGNSGGALVNLRGELIGINTAIIGPSGGNVGIGFAIPINLAHRLMEQIIRYGEVRRGQLGIRGDTLTPSLAHALGLKIPRGVVVTQVIDGSAADEAGIKVYDVITKVDGKPVQNLAQINNYVGLLPAGRQVRLTILRNGEELMKTTTIREPDYQKTKGGQITPLLEGIVLEQHFDASGEKDGVRVRQVHPESRAGYWGLREDDRIVGVGRFDVRTVDRFKELLKDYEGPLTLKIVRGDKWLILTLR